MKKKKNCSQYRVHPQVPMNFDELVVDNFAGGGGASTGIEMAIGRSVDIAINHDPEAIAMHEINHPHTQHFCESVWDIDPREVCAGRPVGLAWFSPDCKHFSKAKGGKPVEKKIRGLAWVVMKWIGTVRPRVIILENVEEFTTWGPLVKDPDGNHRPCPKRKGQTFKSFVNAMERHGYNVEYKELRASDYGTPTIRKRLFLIARCDGQPIVWPNATHYDPKATAKPGKCKPQLTAADCIDWSIPCQSIFERKKPLAEATMRRIARGIMKYVINADEPFIVKVNHGYDYFRGQSINEPVQTITSKLGSGLVVPKLAPFVTEHANGSNQRNMPADEALRTICAEVKGGHFALVTPTLVQTGYGERKGQAARALDLDKPLGTVVAGGQKHALIAPHITKFRANSIGSSADEPLHTVTAGGECKRPAGAAHAMGVVQAEIAPYIARQFGESIGHGVDQPNGTVTAGGAGKSQLVAAFLAKHYGGNYQGPGAAMQGPVPTVTTVDHNALVTSNLMKLRGTCKDGQPVAAPVPTLTAGGNHVGEVRAFLLKYYSEGGQWQDCREPMHTIPTKDRIGLVVVKGELYQIVDIGMRMLEPHELYRAQGFPSDYIHDRTADGKRLSKSAQVRMCGNSVCPPLAAALVRANYVETAQKEAAA